MHSQNKITFTYDNYMEVNCYKKNGGYDIYINGVFIKMNASLEWIKIFKRIMNTSKVLGK